MNSIVTINGNEFLDVSEHAHAIAFGQKQSAEGEPKRKRESSRSRPTMITARELGETEFPPIRFIVPNFLPEGATILAGRPKLGKSWLALDIALAVARGGEALGMTCQQGDVLYLALEDNERRLQSRLHKLCPAPRLDPWPSALNFATEWKRADQGGVEAIRDWASSKEQPRLVIVDVLAAFRAARGNRDDGYSTDYESIKALQELAGELQLAVLIVHHVRKSAGEVDPFEKISGTLGLSGAADTAIILDNDGNGCTLYGRGRDLQEFERAVTFDKIDCRWIVQGEASDVRRSDTRTAILNALKEAGEPLGPKEVADEIEIGLSNVKQTLTRMAKAGEVKKATRGKYCHLDVTEPVTEAKAKKQHVRQPPVTSVTLSPNENEGQEINDLGEGGKVTATFPVTFPTSENGGVQPQSDKVTEVTPSVGVTHGA